MSSADAETQDGSAEDTIALSSVITVPTTEHTTEHTTNSRAAFHGTDKTGSAAAPEAFAEVGASETVSEAAVDKEDLMNMRRPRIDLVHISTIPSQEGLFELATSGILSDSRKLVFSLDPSDFLRADLTQTRIEQLAEEVLSGLHNLRRDDDNTEKRAIIFAAYDFGSLVVKTALSFASKYDSPYGDIFTNTAWVIFCGCPQRSASRHHLESTLFGYLLYRKHASWSPLVNSSTIGHLADCIERSTDSFINSKLPLRSRIVSLHANQSKPGAIHPAFDSTIATLGIWPEAIFEEGHGEDPGDRFAPLFDGLRTDENKWVPHPLWKDIENTLLSLAAPSYPLEGKSSLSDILPVVEESSSYKQWSKGDAFQLLYVDGTSYRKTHELADRLFTMEAGEEYWRSSYHQGFLSFTFDSSDPLRSTLSSMMSTVLVQDWANFRIDEDGLDFYRALKDVFLFQSAWNDESCMRLYTSLLPQADLCIHDFDECDKGGRKLLLEYFRKCSECFEEGFKILVTSKNPGSLSEELEGWLRIDVDDLAASSHTDLVDETESFARLCSEPKDAEKIKTSMETLKKMDSAARQRSLDLLQDHTGWPLEPSRDSLDHFTSLLQQIRADDSPAVVFDKILKSHADEDGFVWALCWLLCGSRPLSRRQLALVLHSHYSAGNDRLRMHSIRNLGQLERRLESWFRGFVDFGHHRVIICPEIRSLLEENTDEERFIWNTAKMNAHRAIAQFGISLIKETVNQDLLASIYRRYEAQLSQRPEAEQITPPIIADSNDILLYMVQSLPYHLSKCRDDAVAAKMHQELKSPKSLHFTLWAKLYWAMSNSFDRVRKAPESHLIVLAELGFLSFEELQGVPEEIKVQCMIAAAASGKTDLAKKAVQSGLQMPDVTDALIASVRAGDEATALEAAKMVLSFSTSRTPCHWPGSLIWATVWQSMTQLLLLLLDNGASPDPQDAGEDPSKIPTEYYACPLYMASKINCVSAVRLLLSHGARTDVLRYGRYGPLYTAAGDGNVEVIAEFVKVDPTLLQLEQPNNILCIASSCGAWKSVKALLEHGMDPNCIENSTTGDGSSLWTPLGIASSQGYLKMMELLLEHGADPNSPEPKDIHTPLFLAVLKPSNMPCIQVLLRHGGDPNSKNISVPLMLALAWLYEGDEAITEVQEVLLTGDHPIQVNAKDKTGDTALIIAVLRGRVSLVRWLLRNGADVNAINIHGRNVMDFGARSGNVEIVKELLQYHPNLELVSKGNRTTLGIALDHPPVVRLLLEAGADPEAAPRNLPTVLGLAVSYYGLEVVKILIDGKANLEARGGGTETPMQMAVRDGRDAAMVRLLAESGVDLTAWMPYYGSLIHRAVMGPPEIMKVLLEFRKGVNLNRLNANGETAIHNAITNGSLQDKSVIENIKLLVRAGADINLTNSIGDAALHIALSRGFIDAFDVLLRETDIDIHRTSPSNGSPLLVACEYSRVDEARQLIAAGADVNIMVRNIINHTPLMAALLSRLHAQDSEFEAADPMVRMLVHNGADVKVNIPGNTFHDALAAACFAAEARTINFLLDEGASAQAVDSISGRVPLHFAAANGIKNFQAFRMSYKGDLLVADREGKNVLHWAAQFGNAETVRSILLELKGNPGMLARYINLGDSDGWTPLCWAVRPFADHWAASMRSERRDPVSVINTLLQSGADRNTRFRLGTGDTAEFLTPLAMAQRWGNGIVLDMLQDDTTENEIAVGGELPKPSSSQPLSVRFKDFCNICLGHNFGTVIYDCITCPDYTVCIKCIASVTTFHSSATKDDGESHILVPLPWHKDDDASSTTTDATGSTGSLPRLRPLDADNVGSSAPDGGNEQDSDDMLMDDDF